MVLVKVNLTPPVSGIMSKLFLVFGEELYPVIDLPPSSSGVISAGIGIGSPELDYVIIVPSQIVEEVEYREVRTRTFNLLSDVNLNLALDPVGPPTPTPNGDNGINGEIMTQAAPALIGVAVIFAVLRLI